MQANASISFIIPTYNIDSKILSRCLNSVISTNLEYECFVVVDGDGNHERYQNLVQQNFQDKQIHVINTSHAGVNHARNIGIKKAKGEWIYFVDADDEINARELESSLEDLRISENTVLVLGNHRECYQSYSTKSTHHKICQTISGMDASNWLLECSHNAGMVWGRLFRRGFIVSCELTLDENLAFAEDCEFMLRFFLIAAKTNKTVQTTTHYIYNYYRNPNSVTKRFDKQYLKRYKNAFAKMREDLSLYGIDQNRIDCFVAHVLIQVTSSYVFNLGANKNIEGSRRRFKEVLETSDFSKSLSTSYSYFSKSRAFVFFCWKYHLYWILQGIAYLRQLQFHV